MREMKDCELSNFSTIPAHWKIQKLKTILTLRSERNSGDRELLSVYLDRGVISYSDSTGMQVHKPSQDLSNYQNVHIGDFVLNNQQAWRGSVGVSKYDGIISPAYFVYHLSQECYPRYMNYLFRDFSMVQQYETSSRGVGTIQRNIFAPWLLNCWTIIPPYDEQVKIANHLDSKCTEIDALIVDIQTQIDTLEQYKRSVITEAVTKGLNPNVEMKDSGVSWLSKLPRHWDVIPSKYLFHNSDVRRYTGDIQLTASQNWGIIPQEEYMERTGAKIVFANHGLENWKHVDPDDFVISLRSFQGGLEMSEVVGCITWHYIVLKTVQPIVPRFYKWLFKSDAYIAALQRTCNFIRDGQDLRYSNFSQVPIYIPPMAEQQQIANYLDERCLMIDETIKEKCIQLSVLGEYKKSLIFEYVTGKKEVPDALMVFGINPHVLRLAIIVDMIKKLNIERKRMGKKALKGKVVNQKFLYLLDEYLEHGLDTRYHRYQNGPFDLQFDSYINILVSNGWYELDTNDGSESLVAGRNHAEFLGRYGNQLTQYKSSVEALTRCFGMMSRRQLEEVATLFAVWNDLIIDGNLAPSNDEIINEAMTNWTPNKGKIPHDTWQNMLMKMKRDGIIPKGLGLHTFPKPDGGKSDA